MARWPGADHDGPLVTLGVTDVAPFSLTGINIRVIWRRDRYLRGSDHISFQRQGYPAARFTEPRENFDHERGGRLPGRRRTYRGRRRLGDHRLRPAGGPAGPGTSA